MVHFLYCIRRHLLTYFDGNDMDIYLEKIIEKYYMTCKKDGSGISGKKRKRELIVSLTTIPDRIDKVWIVIESLLRQTYKPDKIVLWLAEKDFKGIQLPTQLERQRKRGLDIRFCDDIRSYKKFYYTVKENPNAYIITVDDDLIYSEKMVEGLIKEYRNSPGCVICNRSHLMKVRNGKLVPYNSWEMYEKRERITAQASYQNFFTSGGGTLIPFFLMDKRTFDKEVFMNISPTADDVWLNFMAWVSGLKTKNTASGLGFLIQIPSSASGGLCRLNRYKNHNDVHIRNVIDYLNIDVNNFIRR